MANLVESDVLLEFLQGFLAPDFLEHLDVLKYDLGHDELGLPVILSIHVSSLTSDVSDAVVIGDGQLLQVSEKFMPLRLETLDVSFHIDVLVVHA